jgi:hypothetical protein
LPQHLFQMIKADFPLRQHPAGESTGFFSCGLKSSYNRQKRRRPMVYASW